MRFEAIHEADILEDGSVNTLLEVSGTPTQIRACFPTELPRLIDRELSTDGETTMLQLRYEPTEHNRRFLEPFRTYGVIVQYPMVYVEPLRSVLRVTIFGPDDEVQRFVGDMRELATLEVEQVTNYSPAVSHQFDDLTDRQKEVLLTAYEQGYYDTPREATYEDIAAELDCSASSVGQILRRTESALVSATVSDRTLES
ncbi:bacterio-opsin activator [Natrarchaeobaculum aegyptiacum]|uniref:Bacterio-opsin activator n=1 Tax=Natrarchaeobaculum aegyptiacum TaxID=745377 RepID=A0A2Z2HWT2_9EURY|nr:bacterio-opsin activator [Natrarchaeobaculum aegyptiacum]